MKKRGGTSPGKLLCDMEKAEEINKVLNSIFEVAMSYNETETETECQNKLTAIKKIISELPNTRSISEISNVIGGKPKSKFKTRPPNLPHIAF
jgi:hypothetical protein